MEGAVLGMNYGLEILRRKGIRPKEIRVAGGGAKSPLWRKICADVFGAEVVPPAEEEAAALGGAIQAAWCAAKDAGRPEKIADLTKRMVRLRESERATPGEPGATRYRALHAMQNELSSATRKLFTKRLAYLRK
jgi:xylulokinase